MNVSRNTHITCMHTHTHIHLQTRTHTHTQKHTHTYIQTQNLHGLRNIDPLLEHFEPAREQIQKGQKTPSPKIIPGKIAFKNRWSHKYRGKKTVSTRTCRHLRREVWCNRILRRWKTWPWSPWWIPVYMYAGYTQVCVRSVTPTHTTIVSVKIYIYIYICKYKSKGGVPGTQSMRLGLDSETCISTHFCMPTIYGSMHTHIRTKRAPGSYSNHCFRR
jgi:hypothetical protein